MLSSGLAADRDSYPQRFETAWKLVAERYWDLSLAKVDWNEAHERYAPLIAAARDDAEFYALLEAMYAELGDDHSVFVSPARVEEMRALYGDLPCLAVLGQAAPPAGAARQLGSISFELLPGSAGSGHLGYVRIPDLASDFVAGNTRAAVRQLEADGAAAFILDLRGNPGGRLVTMMQVAGIFERGFLWRTITRWSLPLPYPALGVPENDLPLVILIDGGVNSAAEGLAGALQQAGRAVIIGETSAGNVDALLPFCLRDGSQAWVATGVLAPIGAPTWQGTGVIPDLQAASAEALDRAVSYLEAGPLPSGR
jgi:carboxyl-terminal processing protease